MKPSTHQRVLPLDLRPLRFGFAMFEGPDELLDWGVKNARHGSEAVKVPLNLKLGLLLDQYGPDILVIKKPMTTALKKMVRTIATLAQARRIPVLLIPGTSVRGAFPGDNRNKYQIATVIATRFPELLPQLGHRRKVWETEQYSMSIFDAAALGLAYFSDSAAVGKMKDRAIWPVPR